jgi:hypothetical protein
MMKKTIPKMFVFECRKSYRTPVQDCQYLPRRRGTGCKRDTIYGPINLGLKAAPCAAVENRYQKSIRRQIERCIAGWTPSAMLMREAERRADKYHRTGRGLGAAVRDVRRALTVAEALRRAGL